MHDLAPSHNARSTRQLLAQKGVKVLEWPENSPDSNPIKNVWYFVTSLLPKSFLEMQTSCETKFVQPGSP